jgi:hypothetical protein
MTEGRLWAALRLSPRRGQPRARIQSPRDTSPSTRELLLLAGSNVRGWVAQGAPRTTNDTAMYWTAAAVITRRWKTSW